MAPPRGRPTTPKAAATSSPQSSPENVPPLPANVRHSTSHPPRRSSLGGFLRRSKSGDPVRRNMPIVAKAAPKLPDLWVNGSGAHNGLLKETRDSVAIFSGHTDHPPLPSSSGSSVPSAGNMPGRRSTDSPGGQYVKTSSVPLTQDPYANVGSMTNRGRYSYASSAVSTTHAPRRIRRRKDPTPFNILVVGSRNSGKTSFLRFLRQSLTLSPRRGHTGSADEPEPFDPTAHKNESFKEMYLETEIDGERLGITLWDSAGLEKNIVDLQIRNTVAFIESKFEDTFAEETKVVRTPGITDTHIHCVFLLIDPARVMPTSHYNNSSAHGGLDEDLDISVMRALQGKTVVVPIVSKADTLTERNMNELKALVREGMLKASVDPLDPLDFDMEDDEALSTPRAKAAGSSTSLLVAEADEPSSGEASEAEGSDNETTTSSKKAMDPANIGVAQALTADAAIPTRASMVLSAASAAMAAAAAASSSPAMTASLSFTPLSVISPDSYEPDEPVGRRFPWGFADPYDERHCDYVRLKESVFGDWRHELREKSRDVWYENWRSDRLAASGRNTVRGGRRGAGMI